MTGMVPCSTYVEGETTYMEHEARKSPVWWKATPHTACVWSVNVAAQLAYRKEVYIPSRENKKMKKKIRIDCRTKLDNYFIV